jgi:ABC-type transport system involved in multi-copper enzyme maturation permease subunit
MSMSHAASAPVSGRALPWQLWIAQTSAILRLEIKKTLWMRRGIWIYLLALVPVGLIGIHALKSPLGRHCTMAQDTEILAGIFQVFYLRFGIFFGCLGLFTWLFRGEIVEKTLHYYFLSPVRREVLIAGKFLAGLISSVMIFGVSIFLAFAFIYGHFGPAGRTYVFSGPGLGQLVAYLSVTALACLGYGSVFLALSLVFKNPILPGIVVLLWEMFHAVLPPLLQKLTIGFYLKQLCPVSVPPVGVMALFTVVAEPVSAYAAVPGLLGLCAAILLFAFWKIRKFEISYLAD